MSRRKRRKKYRNSKDTPHPGIYLLPNLFTSASLFIAFYSLVAASQGKFVEAGVAIFVSAICDGLDGTVARLTRSTSKFGVEFDSIADVVAFGAAPAFLIHQWATQSFGRLGWVAAALYVVCGALRLARFNVQVGHKDPRFFVGLPIPAAACILASVVIASEQFNIAPGRADILVLVLGYVLSFLMVSNLPYRSMKDMAIRRYKFNFLVIGVLIFSLIAYRPALMGVTLLFAYLASGPAVAIYRIRAKRRAKALEEEGKGVEPEADAEPKPAE